jgi:type IV pilus assembly protein PilQ
MTCSREQAKLWAFVLGAAGFAAWSIPANAETVRVRDIRVSETSGGDTAIVIGASARPTFTTWKLDQPPRVVVELSAARLGDVDVPLDAGTYAVGLVSASVTEDDSAGPRTRIVLTLRQASDYQVESKGTDITLRVIPRLRPPAAVAQTDTRTKVDAEAAAKHAAQMKAEDDARALAKLNAESRAKREAQAQAKAEADARKQAQSRADEEARRAAEAKAETAVRAQAQAKAEARLQDEAKQRQAAQAMAEEKTRSEADARSEAERLRKELVAAQKDAQLARAEASAATLENQRQAAALARAEAVVKQAQAETERANKQAALAESQGARAKRQESERDRAVKAAIQQVENRQKALDEMALSQTEQRDKLAAAERLVAEREASLRASEAQLTAREEESREARTRRDSLARDASKRSKAEAAATVATVARQRKEAARAAAASRLELAAAVASRKNEEARREAQAQARKTEEDKLGQAIALRKSEEARLAQAREERSRIEAERTRLVQEQAQLESSRQALVAEVKELKLVAQSSQVAATPAKVAPATPAAPAAPAPKSAAVAVAAAQPPPATAGKPSDATASARPRSVTLRAISRVRNIDFIDEPSRASVIIDVDDGTSFAVERLAGHRLSLRLDHSELPDSLARNLDATEYLGPVKVISSYRDPAARTSVRIDVDLAEDVPNHVRLDGNRIYWDFQKAQGKGASLPANLVRPPSVLFVPARRVAGFFAVVPVATSQAQVTPPPYLVPPGSAPPAGVAPPAPAANAASPQNQPGGGGRYATLGKKRYTGRRIDLDFKGADIHNILRLLADVGQVNVVVADDVRGDVTIKMRDVPWDQALDVVLRSKGLGSVREGNLLRVAPLALLEKELEAEIARQKQIAEVVPVETRLIGVSYAEASDLMDKARDLLSPRGKISQDHRTNTLIVSDVAKNLQLIEDLVRNLDTQTSQVTIEARIVEANSNFARQIGVQWGGTGFMDNSHGNPTGLVFPYNVGVGGGADSGDSPLGGLVPGARTGTGTTGSPNFLVNMPAPAGLGTGSAIGITLGSVAGAFNLNLRLSAMETTGQVRILSSPRITTMDNVEANISQGVSIPVSVVSAMGAQTQFVDAKLTLSVKPHVTNEGTIAMVINVTRNEPDFVNTGARGDPSIQKKEAKTTMLVRDGDTAVIGGIYTRNTGLSNARVPFFSDIPVLGWFFRNKKENDNRSEFLVFITPRIANRARALGQ